MNYDFLLKELEIHNLEVDKKLDELKERIKGLSSEDRRQRLFSQLKKTRHEVMKNREKAIKEIMGMIE